MYCHCRSVLDWANPTSYSLVADVVEKTSYLYGELFGGDAIAGSLLLLLLFLLLCVGFLTLIAAGAEDAN
jgi:hypothetical protein